MKPAFRWKILLIPVVAVVIILPATAFAERVSVSVRSAVVRTGPDSGNPVAWEKLDRYYPLLVLEKKGDWYHIRDYENDVGWIHKSCVGTTETVIAAKNTCYVRSGPGRDYSIAFVVDNGVPFRVLKKKGKWLKIKHSDGDKGWIHESLTW